METDLIKQDKILSTIGLKRLMFSDSVFNNKSKFKRYITSEYRESHRKEMDEVYRMFEFNLLHIDSGLRLTLTETESYDGESVEYKVISMFITTSSGKKLIVLDADFARRIFYTQDLEIPFGKTRKSIK